MSMPEVVHIEGPQTLTLDVAEVRLIVALLRKQPFEVVASTMDKIREQLLQQKPVQNSVATTEEKADAAAPG